MRVTRPSCVCVRVTQPSCVSVCLSHAHRVFFVGEVGAGRQRDQEEGGSVAVGLREGRTRGEEEQGLEDRPARDGGGGEEDVLRGGDKWDWVG